jgi:hypothetical protein
MTACIMHNTAYNPPPLPPIGLGAEGIIIGGLNYAEGGGYINWEASALPHPQLTSPLCSLITTP